MIIKVNKQKSKISILLNKKFYNKDTIKQSIEDFKEICDGEMIEGKGFLVVLSVDEKELLDVLGYEFCNYVLGLMKNRQLV